MSDAAVTPRWEALEEIRSRNARGTLIVVTSAINVSILQR